MLSLYKLPGIKFLILIKIIDYLLIQRFSAEHRFRFANHLDTLLIYNYQSGCLIMNLPKMSLKSCEYCQNHLRPIQITNTILPII